MINSLKEFEKIHPKSVIVNYDMANVFEFGMTYRTETHSVEVFRTDKNGKYIRYPYIQPYLSLTGNHELFIIRDKKMYQLEKGTKKNTYKIKEAIKNINPLVNDDDVFYNKKNWKKPVVISEDIYLIEE